MARPDLYQRRAPMPGERIFDRWTNDGWLWSAGQVSDLIGVSKRAARRMVARLLRQGQIAVYRKLPRGRT